MKRHRMKTYLNGKVIDYITINARFWDLVDNSFIGTEIESDQNGKETFTVNLCL